MVVVVVVVVEVVMVVVVMPVVVVVDRKCTVCWAYSRGLTSHLKFK